MDKKMKIALASGTQIPAIGFGVWRAKDATKDAVLWALKHGYRHIDTAMIYGNEEAVGQAIKESGIDRSELFITTKVWTSDIREGKVKEAIEISLKKLQLDYVDLYLIHWAVDGYVDTYLEMEELYKEGKIKAIGVANFRKHHLETLMEKAHILPMVDQVEINPQFHDDEIYTYCKAKGIVIEAYSPLGSGACLDQPVIQQLADQHGKSIAQIILRWHVQNGIIPLPKSVHEDRIAQNIDIFDFTLSKEEMKTIDALNTHVWTCADPDNVDF